MPEITPSFTMQYERRMRTITEQEYVRRLSDLWWNKVAKVTNIEGKTERITWLLSTATIEPIGPTGVGTLSFENLVSQTVEYPSFKHGKGIRVQRDQFEDLDGTGLNEVAEWSAQIGNEMAYYPQRLFAQLLLNGAATDGSAAAYDTVPFFADGTTNRTIGGVSVKGHPFNPYRPILGGYPNWLKGSPSTITQPNGTTYPYPGALAIDDSVTADVALQNLGKAIAYVSQVKMPNGVDPRFLKPEYIICPPRMAPRVRQLTEAKFLAQAANSGGGAADVVALISGWGLGTPIVAQELGAAVTYPNAQMPFMTSGGQTNFLSESLTGSDTTWYLVCQEMRTTQLGGLLYVLRKPFKVTYYSGDGGQGPAQADLDRMDYFEYHVKGRMAPAYGHPYTIFRFDNS